MAYSGEICEDCGFPVVHFTGSYWTAPDDLWASVVGNQTAILCPPCFVLRAREKGIHVCWQAASF